MAGAGTLSEGKREVMEEVVNENDSDQKVLPSCDPDAVPEEIWEVIFRKLKDDPEALFNCTLAWSRWGEILFAQKLSFMFPLIIPLISMYLPPSDLLRCRQVCKTVKMFTDKYLSYLPLLIPSEMRSRLFKSNLERGIITFRNYRKIPEFLVGMENHVANPFPARSVVFIEDHRSTSPLPDEHFCDLNRREDDFQEVIRDREESGDIEDLEELPQLNFWEEQEQAERLHRKWFHRMLRKLGSHIWHLKYVPGSSESLIGHPGYLSETLRNLPNLHSLTLYYYNWFSDTEEDVVQLPDLPCLCKLSIFVNVNNNGVHPRLLLQTYGKQLEILDCDVANLIQLENCETACPPFSRLKSLRVSHPSSTTNQALIRTLKTMCIQNLERFYLKLNTPWKEELEPNLITLLSLFSPTLSAFTLEVDCAYSKLDVGVFTETSFESDIEALPLWPLDFSNLKTVSVETDFLESPNLPRVFKMFTGAKSLSIFDRKYRNIFAFGGYPVSKLTSKEDAAKLAKNYLLLMPSLEEIVWTLVDYERSADWSLTWSSSNSHAKTVARMLMEITHDEFL